MAAKPLPSSGASTLIDVKFSGADVAAAGNAAAAG